MLLKCEEFGTVNLSLAGALALFSRDSESNLSSLETLNQMFLEYQAAHLKSGQTNDQLLLKPLLYITFSFPFHEVKTSCIYSVLSTEFLCCMPMSLKVQLLSYSEYSHNRVPTGLPTASPGMLHTPKVHLQSSKCILCLALILFSLIFQSFRITGDTLAVRWFERYSEGNNTFLHYQWTFWLQPQQQSHKSYCYTVERTWMPVLYAD